jgi:hypothetical protein
MAGDVQTIPSGQLVQEFREQLLTLDRGDRAAVRRADLLEEEILRRMAW